MSVRSLMEAEMVLLSVDRVTAFSSLDKELPERTDKPWGYELLWARCARYAAKILHIEGGYRLSLQYHRSKEETLLLVRGRLYLELEGPDGVMHSEEALIGQAIHIPPGCRHRLSAVETCDVLEVSTPELDDVVRLQDDFGRG